MEAEKEEEDPFKSIIELCRPTASQEAKFPNCPLARQSEHFADSSPDQSSSSPDMTPSNPTGILMVSPPGSPGSVQQHAEEEAVFHTPPEHHHLSSSEDQNPNELCAEGLRAAAGAVDGSDKTQKVRGFERELDGEPGAKRIRVVGEEFDGETVPVGETEAIGMEGNEGSQDTKVVVLDSTDSGEEMATVNLAEDSLDVTSEGGVEVRTIDVVRKIGELMKGGMPKVDAVNGNHKLGKKCKYAEGTAVNKGEKPNENSDLSGSLDSGKIEEDIVELKCIVGSKCIEVRRKSGVGGSEKVVKIKRDSKMPKGSYQNGGPETDGRRPGDIGLKTDGKRTEEIGLKIDGQRTKEIGLKTDGKRIEENGLKTNGKRTEEIDEFRYAGDVDKRWKGKTGVAVGGSGRRRQLPVSLKGKEKDVGGTDVVETVETKSGLLDFLDVLKVVVGDTDGGCEDVDFLETAKKRGLTFPKARWWPSEGEDE